jgi:HSP20 family protein
MATDEQKDAGRGKAVAEKPSRNTPARRDDWSAFWGDPFANLWNRWTRDVDRWFDDQGAGRRHWLTRSGASPWRPDVETFQRGDQFVIRADLPGLKKDDVTVQIADDTVTIEGERRNEREEEHEGFYRTERTYGTFSRTVPLPEGAIADTANATFTDGVLEVIVHAPPREVARGRKLEIRDQSADRTPPSGSGR